MSSTAFWILTAALVVLVVAFVVHFDLFGGPTAKEIAVGELTRVMASR